MRARNIIISVIAAGGLLTAMPAAFADDSGPNGRGDPIIGNVVGSPIPDRTVLGSDAAGCTATVQRGLGDGRYAQPVVHHYAIPGLASLNRCPDMGVAVQRRSAAMADLVVTWFIAPPEVTNSLYVLRHFALLSSSAAGEFPSYLGSQDFNGDRLGDIWESTDQDERFSTWLRYGKGFVPGPASFYNISTLPTLAFGPLDNTPGTDIAAGYLSPRRDQQGLPGSAGTGVLVVFGATGGKVLLEHDPTGQIRYTPTLVDANHDGNLDVEVSGGSQPPRIYYGDGAGHFTLGT